MARFDVYKNPSESARRIPYLLDVQSDLLADAPTRIVVPLIRSEEFKRTLQRLYPSFEVEGTAVVMLTLELAGVPSSRLRTRVASLSDRWHEIRDALDFTFQGY